MMQISFKDVLLISEFAGLTEFDLLQTKMDIKVLPYLHTLGMDSKKGYEIRASQHRTLTGKIHTGFTYCGDIRLDKEFRDSPYCSMVDRLVIAGTKDPSMLHELAGLMNSTVNYSSANDCKEEEDLPEGLAKLLYVDGWQKAITVIDSLTAVIENTRGVSMGADGGLKTFEQWTGVTKSKGNK